MKFKLVQSASQSSGKLGDWYAAPLVLVRRQFILAVSSTTRLGVVLDAAPYATFPNRLTDALTRVLAALGVPDDTISAEIQEMRDVTVAKTTDRSVLGTVNQWRLELKYWVHYHGGVLDPLARSLRLSNTGCMALPDFHPQDAVRRVFELPPRPRPRLRVV